MNIKKYFISRADLIKGIKFAKSTGRLKLGTPNKRSDIYFGKNFYANGLHIKWRNCKKITSQIVYIRVVVDYNLIEVMNCNKTAEVSHTVADNFCVKMRNLKTKIDDVFIPIVVK